MYKDYFPTLLGNSGELHWYELDFKDDELEKRYRMSNESDEMKNSKYFSFVLTITYLLFFGINLMWNNMKLVRTAYIILGGMFLEILLAIISCYIHSNKFFFKIKIVRYMIIYIECMIILCFPVMGFSPDIFLRGIYVLFLLLNMFYIYFMHFNYIFLILICIFNTLALLWVQYNVFSNTPFYLLPELVGNFIYQYCIFLIKRNEVTSKKEMYLKNFRNQSHIQYITELVDVLNTMVISIKKNEILYINQFGVNCVEYFHNLLNPKDTQTFLNSSCDFREREVLITDDKKKKDIVNFQLDVFLNSIILDSSYDTNLTNTQEKISLFRIINEEKWLEDKLCNFFVKIGIFGYSTNKQEQFFEVYARKVKMNDEFIELLIYDISSIKTVEKAKVETKYKQKILAKIAHEFKTPLITIITLIQSLNNYQFENELESSIRKKLSHVVNLSNYTIFLIQDIIQYVSETNKLKIALSNVNLKEILNFCFEVLHTLVDCNENKSNKIETFLDFDESIDELIILSDENRLKQILLNLISNSVKFTASGYIKIKTYVDYESNKVVISVEDTGLGIKEEDFSLLFQENIQLNLEKDYNNKGSGLGLSICKLLAKSLDHEIIFESTYGKRTIFNLNLKFMKSRKSIKRRKESLYENKTHRLFDNCSNLMSTIMKDEIPEIDRNEISFRFDRKNSINILDDQITDRKNFDLIKYKNLEELLEDEDGNYYMTNYNFNIISNNFRFSENCILVVDDHKLVRVNTINLIKSILSYHEINNCCIIEGSDGIDLLNIIRKDESGRIKCIFTDENMEYLNGSEAVKIIRKLEQNNKIKSQHIVSITAFDDISTRQNIMSSGVNSILSKPCSKTAITDIILKIFE